MVSHMVAVAMGKDTAKIWLKDTPDDQPIEGRVTHCRIYKNAEGKPTTPPEPRETLQEHQSNLEVIVAGHDPFPLERIVGVEIAGYDGGIIGSTPKKDTYNWETDWRFQ